MASSLSFAPGKFIVDSIHGDIRLTDIELKVIDTPSFQRLRHIKQLQMSQVTYPNATHTRFAHSVGTLGIMDRVLRVAEKTAKKWTKRQQQNLRLAALLHDIGHYPYSHLMEGLDRVELTEEQIDGISEAASEKKTLDMSRTPYPGHVKLGTLIATKQSDIMKAIGSKKRAKEIADLFARTKAADPQLSKFITSSLDLDRLDYLLRDSHAAGVPFGQIDINYLLNSLQISPSGMIGISEKALPAAEQFLLARFFMYRTVYYHKTTFGIEEVCRQLLRRIRDAAKYQIPPDGQAVESLVKSQKLRTFTDAYVDAIIQQAVNDEDDVIRYLAKSIHNLRPPKLLKEVLVLEDKKQDYHAGATFKSNCKRELKTLADKFEIPPGLFLICSPKPITFEARSANLSAREAREMPSEEEDESIRVFVSGKEEPVSLVDVEHSIISKCSGYSFRIFRLYVVIDADDNGEVVKRLRTEVQDWDKSQ